MVITLYGTTVLIHILSAIIGLGASFASPIILKGGKTVQSAQVAHSINTKVEGLVKVGSIVLLITGIGLGFMNNTLFQQGWYWTSIGLYIAIQPIVAYLMPKEVKKQEAILQSAKDDILPVTYHDSTKKIINFHKIAAVVVIVLVIMMSVKPF